MRFPLHSDGCSFKPCSNGINHAKWRLFYYQMLYNLIIVEHFKMMRLLSQPHRRTPDLGETAYKSRHTLHPLIIFKLPSLTNLLNQHKANVFIRTHYKILHPLQTTEKHSFDIYLHKKVLNSYIVIFFDNFFI